MQQLLSSPVVIQQRGKQLRKSILDIHPRTKIALWQVDLCDYSSILSFAARVQKELPRLDGVVANAGIEPTKFELVGGCESTITINVIPTFLLSILVLPKLKESAEKFRTRTNLSFVGSMQQVFAPHEELQVPDIFGALSKEETADMTGRYGLSKLMAQLCTRELAQRLGENSKIVVNVVNPGWCDTGLSSKGFIPGLIFGLIGRTAEAGGRTLTHAVTAGEETNGKYLSECQIKNESEFARSAEGEKTQKALWKALGEKLETIENGVMGELR